MFDDQFNSIGLRLHAIMSIPGSLFTKADRTYDRTAVVRHASQVYDLFKERVASDNRIVGL